MFQAHRFFPAMIQSPTHKVCSRRANRPLSGRLAFKLVSFIATVPLAMVLPADGSANTPATGKTA